MNPRHKAIRQAIKSYHGASHPSKKAAPGINHDSLTSKERYYRKSYQNRSDSRFKRFEQSGFGRHLTERARRRGEED